MKTNNDTNDLLPDGELLQSLLEQIPAPVMLLRQDNNQILLNHRCELLVGFNGKQITYLNRIRQFSMRHWLHPGVDEYHIVINNSAAHYVARRVSSSDAASSWTLLSLELPSNEGKQKRMLPFDELVGHSKIFRDTVEACHRAGSLGQPVLLYGESGTGKEALAYAMHLEGPFPKDNFICIHNNTEFTKFEQEQETDPAYIGSVLHNHTFYVDEVANFNHYNQDRLFFLIRRSLGGDYKVVCATSADLATLLVRGEWHRNLHDVLNASRIDVPPLRKRREDIPLLAQYFLTSINKQTGRSLRFAPETLTQLRRYEWPGNLYDLESFLMRAVRSIEDVDGEITTEALEQSIRPDRDMESNYNLQYAEKELLLRALNDFSGEKCPKEVAARALGISLATLYRKMDEYGIRKSNFYES